MTVSTLAKSPNFDTIDDAAAVYERIAGPFAPHAQAQPNLTIQIDPGYISKVGGLPDEVVAQDTASITAPTTNPRNDIVYIDQATGALGVATGTEAASPTDPSIPGGKVAVARIRLRVNINQITNNDIDDLRNSPSGATGFTSAVRAYSTANQSITVDTTEKVELNAETYDVDGEFDTTNNKFTANAAGKYLVHGQVLYLSPKPNSRIVIHLRVNSVTKTDTTLSVAFEANMTVNSTDIFDLSENDTIEMYTGVIGGGVDRNISLGEANTFLNVKRLS